MGHEGRHIPNRLKKYRSMMGYTQTDVAKLLGLESTCRLSRWEKGSALPNVINLFKLGILYRTLPEELYRNVSIDLRKDIREMESLIGKS